MTTISNRTQNFRCPDATQLYLYQHVAGAIGVAVLALGLVACGGGANSGPTNPDPVTLNFEDLSASTTKIPAGESRTIGMNKVSCAAGGEDCVLTVKVDTDKRTATATGGTLTVVPISKVDLMGSEDLSAGTTTTIKAGKSDTTGMTIISCAADGPDCELNVMEDSDGNLTATATGGRLTVIRRFQVDLMGSEDLNAGTTTIPAGESVTVGMTTLACATGDKACELTVRVDPVTGKRTGTRTGGTLTVRITPGIVRTPVDLMGSEDLSAGTTTIAAGESVTTGMTTLACATGGQSLRAHGQGGPSDGQADGDRDRRHTHRDREYHARDRARVGGPEG